jgi:hypothetical protein
MLLHVFEVRIAFQILKYRPDKKKPWIESARADKGHSLSSSSMLTPPRCGHWTYVEQHISTFRKQDC